MAHFNRIHRNVVALEVVEKRREPMYHKTKLRTGRCGRTKAGVTANDQECARRTVLRGLLDDLSRYYPLQGDKLWSTRALVMEGKRKNDHSTS